MSRAACGRPSALLFSAIFFNFLGSLKSSASTAFNDSVFCQRAHACAADADKMYFMKSLEIR